MTSDNIGARIGKHWDIIQAHHEGEEIQIWDEHCGWMNTPSPSWSINHKYRAKPKVVTRWLNIYSSTANPSFWDTKEQADRTSSLHRIACVEITYSEGEGL